MEAKPKIREDSKESTPVKVEKPVSENFSTGHLQPTAELPQSKSVEIASESLSTIKNSEKIEDLDSGEGQINEETKSPIVKTNSLIIETNLPNDLQELGLTESKSAVVEHSLPSRANVKKYLDRRIEKRDQYP